ncbi:MAG: IS66 family insertion sequence element accessory protein TnpA [Terriglobia bacterium]
MAHRTQARKKIVTVNKWKASGLSQAEFCRREGLQQWQLSEWKRFVEVLERQEQDVPARLGEESSIDDRPAAGKRRRKAGRRTYRPGRPATLAEPQPFVPVRLVDVAAEAGRGADAARIFDCVLEVVLERGQIVRVASNCEPRFLSAVVSALDT